MMQNNDAPSNRLLNLEGVELPRGNYYLEKLVSVSNMSVIYKSVDRSSQRHVAVKILLNERYYQRFKKEVDITWGQKNNVASAIRYDIEGERLPDGTLIRYLVMKWLSGPSLSERIRGLRMESRSTQDLLEFSTRVLAKIATALDEMHRIGIVHLDIKPSNILFNTDDFENDEPYIIDFGIAQWIRETEEDRTVVEPDDGENRVEKITAPAVDQDRPGTANYMPPEQWAGIVTSGATDQYALAITMYEILSGRVSPYQQVLDVITSTATGSSMRTGRREAWRKGHETEEPTPVHTYRPDLPRAVWPVLLKAMDKDPRKRYSTVGEFYRAFRDVALHPLETLPAPEHKIEQAKPDTPAPAPRKSNVVPLVLGAIGLLAVIWLGIIFLTNQPSGDNTPTPIAFAAVTETVDPTASEVAPAVTDEPTERPSEQATDQPTQEAVLLATEEAADTAESPTDTEAPTEQPTNSPTDEPTNSATRTRRPTATDTYTPTPSLTPTDTATRTYTPSRTPSQTPTATNTPTPVPADAMVALTQISDASRSANNFNCVDFIAAYAELETALDTLAEDEQAVVSPLFARTGPLLALNEFCAEPRNQDDESVQLSSNLASDEFRDLRTLLRATIRDLEALRGE